QLRLDLELTGADYSTVRALFIDFEKTPPSEAVRPRVPSNKDGILDLKVQSEGSAKNLYAHSGFGRVTLAHENLAQIQLLGPLSMILEKTPLGFTSLTLNQMESDFALADGFIKFSPLKITGPQATIEANGTLQMADQALDLVVGVNLIGNLNKKFNPLWRLTDAINPLNYLMQFRITGTLDNQTIRSLYDPRNLLPEGKN
ncbi:MAG: AsmA-like C-terminal region-containing protein, partial [Opitutales bacterium]